LTRNLTLVTIIDLNGEGEVRMLDHDYLGTAHISFQGTAMPVAGV
jgi:hypothetical protein